ncbi:MAG TPA: hypothetical protein VF814_01350 [Casimicrobiaceae bacterium]
MPNGRVRVVGAFAQGRMTGTFIFWNATGARIAVLPLDNDVRSGTIALWYTAPDGRGESGHQLEAPYVDDRLHGIKRTWYPNGVRRAEYRYERDALTEARAWSEGGAPLPQAEARRRAAHDADADEQVYASLVALVRENLPICDANVPNGETPRETPGS